MRREQCSAFLCLVALASTGCTPELQTQWTPYRQHYLLTEREENCSAHVAHDHQGIPPHVPIASLSYEVRGGLAGSDPEAVVEMMRRQTCRIGADGVIIPEESRASKFFGGTAVGTVFMWARPAPGVQAHAVCAPVCRQGFVCVAGACVSACNPPCGPASECVVSGTVPTCVATPPTSGAPPVTSP